MSTQSKDKCSECGGAMEVGFLPEVAPSGSPGRTMTGLTAWYGGEWVPETFLGFKTGGTKIDWNDAEPVAAYRCSQCGFIKLYATKRRQ